MALPVNKTKKKILIVKLSAIGDVIHTLPSLNAIRENYPDSHITWVVEEAASDFVKGHKAIDRVIISRRKTWIKHIFSTSCLQTIKQIYAFIKAVRDTRYDLVIDFQTLLKSGLIVLLSRGKQKAGFGKGMEHMEHSYLFLNKRMPPVDMNHHAVLRSLMLLKSLGIPSDKIVFDLPVSHGDRKKAEDLLTQNGVSGSKPVVAINPVAKWKTKMWDNAKFAMLADRLIETCDAHVVFTGSKTDFPVADEIISGMTHQAVNLAGKTTLKTLAAVFESADLVVSTDTGPMHVAAAIGTPVVAVFGPTAPWRTGPFGSGHRIIRTDMTCSPCFKRKCETAACMKEISVESVFTAASGLL